MSKSTIKRKTVKLRVVNKKEGNTSTKSLGRPILAFWDNDVRGIPKEIFPLVIMIMISNFDESRILINGGISYNIMNSDFFEKMGFKK